MQLSMYHDVRVSSCGLAVVLEPAAAPCEASVCEVKVKSPALTRCRLARISDAGCWLLAAQSQRLVLLDAELEIGSVFRRVCETH